MRKAALLLCVGLASAAAGPAAFDPARIAGPYGHHFRHGHLDGSAYCSADVREIVKLDPNRAYIRAELQFYNGHQCSISGIAHEEARGLVYREREPNFEGAHCVLEIHETANGVRLDDGGSCH